MATPRRGEVWLIDLGMVAKVRPCLVLSIEADDSDRALVTIVPHTTAVRASRFEVASNVAFLKIGAFDTQNLITIPAAKFIRRLGELPAEQFEAVQHGVCRWLGIRLET